MHKKIISFIAFIISDLTALLGSFYIAYYLRAFLLGSLFYKYKTLPLWPFEHYRPYFYICLLWLLIFGYEKLYTKRYPLWEEVFLLIKSSTVAFGSVMIMIFITRKQIQFSRTAIVLFWVLSLFFLPVFRYFIKMLLIKMRIWNKKLLIIGANPIGLNIVKSIQKNKSMGYEIIGFLDNNLKKLGKNFHGIPVIAPISELENVGHLYNSKDIFIALPNLSKDSLNKLLQRCGNFSESIRFVPRIGDIITTGVEAESLGQILTLNVKNNLLKPWNRSIKLFYEIILSFILTALLLPLFIIIAIAIKLDSKGPIFFIQKRIGKDGKPFNMAKFRSMYVDSDERLNDYLKSNSRVKQEWKIYRKIRGYDPRVTRVGKIIRRYSFDELPQLFNVLEGNMSLVGPRPYLSEELIKNKQFKTILEKVQPGLTGLWQISGRNALRFRERTTIDEYYIRNWSLWLDAVILLRTIKALFSRQGAY
jgi:Undecaprenyl-phosphate galactose phosphotransferase WbaP